MCDIQTSYTVQGMTRASCATKVREAVDAVAGVTATNVDIANSLLTVSGHIDDTQIRDAIAGAGYSISEAA